MASCLRPMLLMFVAHRIIRYYECTSCKQSEQTIKEVVQCPKNHLEWIMEAKKVNCPSIDQSCTNPENFVYHCVLNTKLTAYIQVCAPKRPIYGKMCAEYNEGGNIIQESLDANCGSHTIPCPQVYPSTDAYKYQECYYVVNNNQNQNEGMAKEIENISPNEDMTKKFNSKKRKKDMAKEISYHSQKEDIAKEIDNQSSKDNMTKEFDNPNRNEDKAEEFNTNNNQDTGFAQFKKLYLIVAAAQVLLHIFASFCFWIWIEKRNRKRKSPYIAAHTMHTEKDALNII